ncbi:hypothetical protein ALMA_0585 [Alloscardovia macacae]|uniref:Uncharacterized protein n=1 Tax=Alloscardovia macacae TaxID=1160091 RepID=A0A261F4U0_9BIFI|nr:hypothetical protein ALMA_0585 [Alloscardovia macacae]
MTREILKDHASHSWQTLAGYSYYPTTVEQIIYITNSILSKQASAPDWLKSDELTAATRHVKPVDEKKRSKLRALLEPEPHAHASAESAA